MAPHNNAVPLLLITKPQIGARTLPREKRQEQTTKLINIYQLVSQLNLLKFTDNNEHESIPLLRLDTITSIDRAETLSLQEVRTPVTTL
jgi:hypothetical protein